MMNMQMSDRSSCIGPMSWLPLPPPPASFNSHFPIQLISLISIGLIYSFKRSFPELSWWSEMGESFFTILTWNPSPDARAPCASRTVASRTNARVPWCLAFCRCKRLRLQTHFAIYSTGSAPVIIQCLHCLFFSLEFPVLL